MFDFIIKPIAEWIVNIISVSGYWGVFFLMTVESALIPLPSEITMPFAGSLINLGKFNLLLLSLVGALGNLAGSLLAYALGFWGQESIVRKIIRKWGKYLLIKEKELDHAERWFRKYGDIIVLTSRLMPAVRTFISLPAGIAQMSLKKFILYTSIGSFIWSLFLAYIGMVLGENWQSLEGYFRRFDLGIIILSISFVIFYIYHKTKS